MSHNHNRSFNLEAHALELDILPEYIPKLIKELERIYAHLKTPTYNFLFIGKKKVPDSVLICRLLNVIPQIPVRSLKEFVDAWLKTKQEEETNEEHHYEDLSEPGQVDQTNATDPKAEEENVITPGHPSKTAKPEAENRTGHLLAIEIGAWPPSRTDPHSVANVAAGNSPDPDRVIDGLENLMEFVQGMEDDVMRMISPEMNEIHMEDWFDQLRKRIHTAWGEK